MKACFVQAFSSPCDNLHRDILYFCDLAYRIGGRPEEAEKKMGRPAFSSYASIGVSSGSFISYLEILED